MAPKVVRSALAVFFEYDTPRIVHIKSKKVGIFNRLLQLSIIAYVIGYVIIYEKGYQDTDDVQGAITTKLKGVALTNYSTEYPGLEGVRIWDVTDYVVPPQENNAFFVTTNVLITPKQAQGTCPEDPSIFESNCTKNEDCPAGTPIPTGNGYRTGNCVDTNVTGTVTKVCEIYAWCPVENPFQKRPKEPVLLESKNFTVFIKNNIEFPKFDVKRRNLPDKATDDYLRSCNYDSNKFKDCPIFQLKTIVAEAGEDYDNIALQIPAYVSMVIQGFFGWVSSATRFWKRIKRQGCEKKCELELESSHFDTPYVGIGALAKCCSSDKRRNILGFDSNEELAACRFQRDDPQNKFCPIFILEDIVKYSGEDDYQSLAKSGGVIQIIIKWNCNFDHSVDNCVPEYGFRRLDKANYTIAKGYNFRYAKSFIENNTWHRKLVKAYGIRFIVTLEGEAGKFSVIPLFLNIGSGLALLSVATIICDIFVLYCLKARKYYYDKKYLTVKSDDAYETLDEDGEETLERSTASRGSTCSEAAVQQKDSGHSN